MDGSDQTPSAGAVNLTSAAKLLGISRVTLYNWRKNGLFPTPGPYIFLTQIFDYLRSKGLSLPNGLAESTCDLRSLGYSFGVSYLPLDAQNKTPPFFISNSIPDTIGFDPLLTSAAMTASRETAFDVIGCTSIIVSSSYRVESDTPFDPQVGNKVGQEEREGEQLPVPSAEPNPKNIFLVGFGLKHVPIVRQHLPDLYKLFLCTANNVADLDTIRPACVVHMSSAKNNSVLELLRKLFPKIRFVFVQETHDATSDFCDLAVQGTFASATTFEKIANAIQETQDTEK